MSTDDKFEEHSRELLRASADGIEARIRSRLTRARYAAVEEASAGRPGLLWRAWVPAGGLAAVVLAVLLWNGRGVDQPPDVSAGVTPPTAGGVTSPMDDLDLMMASESFEMLEDLEFYEWLDSELADGERDVG